MRKYYLLFAVVLSTLMLFASGCGGGSDDLSVKEQEVIDDPAAETEVPMEDEPAAEEVQPEEDLLSGLSGNRSAEICTSYKAYDAFIGIKLGLSLEDTLAGLATLGMIELKPLEDTLFDTQKTQYGYEDEKKEAYFDMEFAEGILIKKMYHIPFSIDVDSGFKPTKGIYDAIHELMKAGTVNTLADVETYFGPAYLFSEAYADNADPDAGLNLTYRWRGGMHNIDIFTDESGTLKGFKIGSSALPE